MNEVGLGNFELDKKTKQSQAFFNRFLLKFYDFVVYKFVSEKVWGFENEKLLDRHRKYLGTSHLEVGVGTGYVLKKVISSLNQLTIMDLSEDCLEKAGERLSAKSPDLIRQNILEACKSNTLFDSIALNYVLHCVPGGFRTKGFSFKNLKELMSEDAVIFGLSVVYHYQNNVLAKLALWILNKLGIFNNKSDSADELEAELNKYFRYVNVKVINSVIQFEASDYPIEEFK